MIYGIEDLCMKHLDTKVKIALKQGANLVKQSSLHEDKLESQLEFARVFIKSGIPEHIIRDVLGIAEENIELAKKSTLN